MKKINLSAVVFSSILSIAAHAGTCTPVNTNRLINGVNVHAGISCPADGSLSKFVEVSLPSNPGVTVMLSQQNAAQDSAAYNQIPTNVENNVSMSTAELSACIEEIVDRGLTSNQLIDAQLAVTDKLSNDPATQAASKQDFINTCFESTDFSYRP